jgi:hypothetical protein
MRVGVRPSSPDQSLTLPELRPTFGRKLLDRERGSARHCGLNLLAHLSLGRSGTPLRGGGVLFRHAASLSGMSQLTACAISTSAMSPDPNNSIRSSRGNNTHHTHRRIRTTSESTTAETSEAPTESAETTKSTAAAIAHVVAFASPPEWLHRRRPNPRSAPSACRQTASAAIAGPGNSRSDWC